MKLVAKPTVVVATFLWIGFVCAISFMEAWLKFRAPGITVNLGLGIGRLVFMALNKVEWLLAAIIFISYAKDLASFLATKKILILVALCVLTLQTVWLLPTLDARAEILLKTNTLPPSHLHLYYVFAEVIKVGALTIFGISQFKTQR